MQNLPWKSWGTWHDWRQDLHYDSLMHFTLWRHCMLHSSWKRAYIKSQSSLFFSLYFLIISFARIRSQRGPIWGGEIILPPGRDACGPLPWVPLVTWESVLSRRVLKVFCSAVEWLRRLAFWWHPHSWLSVEILLVSDSAIFLMSGVRKWTWHQISI